MYHINSKGQKMPCTCKNILDCPFKANGHFLTKGKDLEDNEKALISHSEKVNDWLGKIGSEYELRPDGRVVRNGKKEFTTKMPVNSRFGKKYLATRIMPQPFTIYHFTETDKYVKSNIKSGNEIDAARANELVETGKWKILDVDRNTDIALYHAQLINSFGKSKLSRRTLRRTIEFKLSESASDKLMIRTCIGMPIKPEDLNAEKYYVSHSSPRTAMLPKLPSSVPESTLKYISSSRQEIMTKTALQRVKLIDGAGNITDTVKAHTFYQNHPYVIGEQYVMSQRMANSLTLIKKHPSQTKTDKYTNIEIFKEIGEHVVRNDVIAILTLTTKTQGDILKRIYARRAGQIISMKIAPTCIDIVIEAKRTLVTGDKLIDNYGNKGVIKVIPDKELEEITGNSKIDILASADGTARRGAWGPAIEMGLDPETLEGQIVNLEGQQEFHVLDHMPENKISTSTKLGIFEQGIMRTVLGDTLIFNDYRPGNAMMNNLGIGINDNGDLEVFEDEENYQLGINVYQKFMTKNANSIKVMRGEKLLPYGREPIPENLVSLSETEETEFYSPRKTMELMFPKEHLLPAAGVNPEVKTKATLTQHFHTPEREAVQILKLAAIHTDFNKSKITREEAEFIPKIVRSQEILRLNIISTNRLHAIKLDKAQRAVATNDPTLAPKGVSVPESSPFKIGDIVGIKRDPAISSDSIQFVRVERKGGLTIEVNPLLSPGMNLDHDGDTVVTFQSDAIDAEKGYAKPLKILGNGLAAWQVEDGEPLESALKKVRNVGRDSAWDSERIRHSDSPNADYSKSLRTIKFEGYKFKKAMSYAPGVRIVEGDCGTKDRGLFGCKAKGCMCSKCNEVKPFRESMQEAMSIIDDRYQGKLDSIKRADSSTVTKDVNVGKIKSKTSPISVSRILGHKDVVKVLTSIAKRQDKGE